MTARLRGFGRVHDAHRGGMDDRENRPGAGPTTPRQQRALVRRPYAAPTGVANICKENKNYNQRFLYRCVSFICHFSFISNSPAVLTFDVLFFN